MPLTEKLFTNTLRAKSPLFDSRLLGWDQDAYDWPTCPQNYPILRYGLPSPSMVISNQSKMKPGPNTIKTLSPMGYGLSWWHWKSISPHKSQSLGIGHSHLTMASRKHVTVAATTNICIMSAQNAGWQNPNLCQHRLRHVYICRRSRHLWLSKYGYWHRISGGGDDAIRHRRWPKGARTCFYKRPAAY
jgi:hypothetical protein